MAAAGLHGQNDASMIAPSPSPTDRAEALATSGQVNTAVALLEQAAAAGDGQACFTLAAWFLGGQHLQRHLGRSRDWFGRAAAAGHPDAASIHIALLANGTGGARSWTGALERLRARTDGDRLARRQLELIDAMALDDDGNPQGLPSGKALSDVPAVTMFQGLLTNEECAYLVAAADGLFAPSTVVDPSTKRLIRDPVRTSDVAAFPLVLEDPAIHAINRRLAAASATGVDQGEPLQVLRYRPGQEYKLHSDALPPGENQRVLTMILWLNEDFLGGETRFLATGLTVRGRIGDALLFRNVDVAGRADPSARHAGLPVTEGVKYLASRWIRQEPLDLGEGSPR